LASNNRMISRDRSLRASHTDAENKLWWSLRASQILGVKFRRQFPIAPYIVDFCSKKAKLIVEVDGSPHQDAVEYDRRRTKFLEQRGYRVVRVTNIDVLTNLDGVLETIYWLVADRRQMNVSPSP
jgi:very-short-patch-repair endonuclease